MSFDITPLLAEWEYEPGKVMVRRFQGEDDIEKIQLRVDLGVLQMNVHGRPDGKSPNGYESYLEYYEAQQKQAEENGETFTLDNDDCAKLQQEAIQYYHRYICLFELGDYHNVLRDTDRNLRLFDFVKDYAESEELVLGFQQFRPQLLMIRTRAESSLEVEQENYQNAKTVVENGIHEIEAFYDEFAQNETADQSGEIQYLKSWLEEIESKRPISERERLENALEEAVGREDYEKAAKMRDALRKLEQSSS